MTDDLPAPASTIDCNLGTSRPTSAIVEAITIGAPQTTIDKLTQAYNDAEKAL